MDYSLESTMALVTFWGVRVVSALLILIAGWMIGNWTSNRIKNIDKLDGTLKSFLGGLTKYTILAVAIVTVLAQFGVQTASLIAVLGAAGLAIGLALQGTLSNVAAGVMLLILRPFNVGDYIEAGGIGGTVKSLGLFATEFATPDNVYIFVPNSKIWNNDVKNYNRNLQRRMDLAFGIGYGDDINKGLKTLQKILDKDKRLVRTEGKEPFVFVTGLGDSSVDLVARIWVEGKDYWQTKWDLTKAGKEALDQDGLNIPFPTRTLEMSSDAIEAMVKASSKKKAA